MIRYLRDPMGAMPAMVREYGDPFTFPGKTPLVCTGEPEGIKAIYAADPDAMEPLSQELAFVLGPQSLILIGGAEHRRKRKLMMPPFHGARMRAYGDGMRRLALHHLRDWTPGANVVAYEVMQRISLDVILEAVFGVRDRRGRASLGKLLLDYVEGVSPLIALFPALRRRFFGLGPYAALLRRREALHARLDALIVQARAEDADAREDILGMLVQARDEDGEPMTDEDVRAQLILLVVAGYETTAASLAWALYAVHRPENAEVLARLRRELDTIDDDTPVEEVAKLPYLDAVCHETLRRFPLAPAPAPRRLLEPMTLMGHELPAGVGVAAGIGVAHFREQTYPDPMTFDPERFVGRRFTPFELLPFGGGARRCLGAAMASYEMRIVLATILRTVHLRLASDKPDPGKVRAATVGPAHGVAMIVQSRP